METPRIFLLLIATAAALGILLGGAVPALTTDSLPRLPLYTGGPVHWHAHLSVIDGEDELVVPADVGLLPNAPESPIHTHDETGWLHVEAASQNDLPPHTLAHFFTLWGQSLNASCATDLCTTAYRQLDFYVNGRQRLDWLTYDIQDGDDIEFVLEDDIEALRA